MEREQRLLQQKFANEAFRGAYRVETTEDDRETGTAVGGEDAGGEEVADVLRSSPRGWRGEEDTVGTGTSYLPAPPTGHQLLGPNNPPFRRPVGRCWYIAVSSPLSL